MNNRHRNTIQESDVGRSYDNKQLQQGTDRENPLSPRVSNFWPHTNLDIEIDNSQPNLFEHLELAGQNILWQERCEPDYIPSTHYDNPAPKFKQQLQHGADRENPLSPSVSNFWPRSNLDIEIHNSQPNLFEHLELAGQNIFQQERCEPYYIPSRHYDNPTRKFKHFKCWLNWIINLSQLCLSGDICISI